MAAESPHRAAAPRWAARSDLLSTRVRRRFDAEYWAGIRFLVFGRAVPCVLFGSMGWLQLAKLRANVEHLAPGAGLDVIGSRILAPALYTAFCSIPAVIYLTRPMPSSRDGRLVARAAAFTGTLMQLVVGAFLGSGTLLYTVPPLVWRASVVVSVASFAGALWTLAYLRRSLSIIPEARRLSTTGPYRLVRHPLYLFEIMAAAAALVSGPGTISVVAFVIFVGMQATRAHFEERLLTSAFSEYADYARRTRRLVPFVL